MHTLKFSVHEFVTIMGILSERVREGDGVPSTSVFHAWKSRYDELDRDLEKLDMMERADMLFDGKVSRDNVTREHIEEVMEIVVAHRAHEQKLIDDGDIDADQDELDIWNTVYARLETSLEWNS